MPKSGLTSADKEWIADLVISTVKSINDGLDAIEQDIKAIKECGTIKKRIKKKMMNNLQNKENNFMIIFLEDSNIKLYILTLNSFDPLLNY